MWLLFVVFIIIVLSGLLLVKKKNMDIWLFQYIQQTFSSLLAKKQVNLTLYVCIADHYEPYCGGADGKAAIARVEQWHNMYMKIAAKHTDSAGRHPQHTFFYPEEEYDEEAMNLIANIVNKGFGDVEVHLHHENDTAEALKVKLTRFTDILHKRHGLLHKSKNGNILYAFIHGNWALDNSHPEKLYCGVDNELDVLEETGCYMDMTMPSAPCRTQTKTINSIYFAKGAAGKSKSHDVGIPLKEGRWKQKGEILMVQGPLALNWRQRKYGILPRIEAGELSCDAPADKSRVALWIRYAPRIKGIENCIFLKLHAHGANDRNLSMMLNGGLEKLWTLLESQVKEREGFKLSYVTAREMYNKLESLANG